MCPQLRIIIRGIRICISRTRENRAALNARLQPLLPQRQPFQVVQSIPVGGAIKHRVFQQHLSSAVVEESGLGIASAVVLSLLEFPGVAAFVVEEAGVVVAFVEVFEDGGKYLGEFLGEVDSFCGGFEELAATDSGEEG